MAEKKRSWLLVLVILAGIVIVGIYARLPAQPDLMAVRRSRQVMGTLAKIEVVVPPTGESEAHQLLEQAFAQIEKVEAQMSTYRPESLLSRVNRLATQQPVELDEGTWQVMQTAEKIWQLSGGAFDPTCGPLIQLWKQCGKENRLPTEHEIAAAQARTGWPKLQFQEANGIVHVQFAKPDMRIDLGGVAKGYAVDLALEQIKKSGCVGGLVDIGGDLRVFGRPADADRWLIAVRNPFEPGFLLTLAINDAAVCTSGNYHRFVMIQGQRYSHIIDPRSGAPADPAPSVTVIGPEAAMADALATALSVLGPDDGMKLIERLEGYEALFVVGTPREYKLIESSGFKRFE